MTRTVRTPGFHPLSVRAPLVALVLVVGVTAIPARASAATPCPSAAIFFQRVTDVSVVSEATVYDSTFSVGPEFQSHVTFDRTQGRVYLSARSFGRLTTSVRVMERFDVVGVAPGTPVAATIQLRLDGWSRQDCGGSGCGVRFEGTLVAGGGSTMGNADQQGPGYRTVPLATTLSLPVTFVAGTPIQADFFIDYGTGPGGDASAEATGLYGVSDLPAGVRAVACGGADVTPVRRASWGRLKSIYR
jgi:hypothetical protein